MAEMEFHKWKVTGQKKYLNENISETNEKYLNGNRIRGPMIPTIFLARTQEI